MQNDLNSNAEMVKWAAISFAILAEFSAIVKCFNGIAGASAVEIMFRAGLPIVTLGPIVAAQRGWKFALSLDQRTSDPSMGAMLSSYISTAVICAYGLYAFLAAAQGQH